MAKDFQVSLMTLISFFSKLCETVFVNSDEVYNSNNDNINNN